MTNKYGVAFFALLSFSVPSISFATALTQAQAESLIGVVQSSPGTPANVFTGFITAFSHITVAQAESLIGVVQSSPGTAGSAFVGLLISFTQDTQPSIATVEPTVAEEATPVTPAQNPVTVVEPVAAGPVATEISIQSQVCNLKNSNLKTTHSLADLLQGGNIDGRIFMNAFILDSEGKNYYQKNPSATMVITSTIPSQSETQNGSGNLGPCGFYYPYELYATTPGTYTVTYSLPDLGLERSITITLE